jgi:hypothetical protein
VVRTVTHRVKDIITTQPLVVEVAVELVYQLVLAVKVVAMVATTQVVMVDQEMDVDLTQVVRVVILVKMGQVVTQDPMVTVGTI